MSVNKKTSRKIFRGAFLRNNDLVVFVLLFMFDLIVLDQTLTLFVVLVFVITLQELITLDVGRVHLGKLAEHGIQVVLTLDFQCQIEPPPCFFSNHSRIRRICHFFGRSGGAGAFACTKQTFVL